MVPLGNWCVSRITVGAVQIIITTNIDTTKAMRKVVPVLNGKLIDMAFSVSSVSVMDPTCALEKLYKYSDRNKVLSQALEGPLKDILDYTKDQVISCDFNSDTHSSIFDAWASIDLHYYIAKFIYW
ncbi:Glyceraldehyde-3-phosphate dehydrogenase [Plecturocebus cupreus]